MFVIFCHLVTRHLVVIVVVVVVVGLVRIRVGVVGVVVRFVRVVIVGGGGRGDIVCHFFCHLVTRHLVFFYGFINVNCSICDSLTACSNGCDVLM